MEFATQPHMNPYSPHGPPHSGPEVPPGWTAQFNEQYQTWFYVNLHTHQSQWEPPTAPVFPPNTAAPQSSSSYDLHDVPRTYHDGDEELARRLQAEEDAAAAAETAGRSDSPPAPPQPPRPQAIESSGANYPTPSPGLQAPNPYSQNISSHPVASSPYAQQPESYTNGHSPYPQSNGNYAPSTPYQGTSPYPPQSHQASHASQSTKDKVLGKVMDKVGNKVPLAAGLGIHSSPRPTSHNAQAGGYRYSHHGGQPSQDVGHAAYSTSNGNLAPPGPPGTVSPNSGKRRSKWGLPATAAAGGAGLLGAGAGVLGGHALGEKVKHKLSGSHSDDGLGSGHNPWGHCDCYDCRKKHKHDFGDFGGGEEEQPEQDSSDGDDGGDDGGDGGGEDVGGDDGGGGVGEVLGALLSF